jgi:peptidoglycan-associated lipoprotein
VAGPAGPAGATTAWESFKDILFDYDRSDIRASETGKIDEIAGYLRRNPTVNLRIDGFADPRGGNTYNLALSQRRVNAVRDALVKAGTPAERISTGHFGQMRPKCVEANEACWQLDRRVEVFVTTTR